MLQHRGSGTLVDALDLAADQVDRETADRIVHRVRGETGSFTFILQFHSGAFERLPVGFGGFILSALEEVAAGNTVALVTEAQEVSTSVAAEFLGVSRPHVVKLIDTGALPARMAGTHRRVRMIDIAAYKRLVERRRGFLNDLASESQEAGLYDDPPTRFAR